MRMHDVTFTGHNVLADEELRQGIKEFSNWPTIPQVDCPSNGSVAKYIFSGLSWGRIHWRLWYNASDASGLTLNQLWKIFNALIPIQSGELIEELGKVGIKSALASETEEKWTCFLGRTNKLVLEDMNGSLVPTKSETLEINLLHSGKPYGFSLTQIWLILGRVQIQDHQSWGSTFL